MNIHVYIRKIEIECYSEPRYFFCESPTSMCAETPIYVLTPMTTVCVDITK